MQHPRRFGPPALARASAVLIGLAGLMGMLPGAANAAPRTVCTVTINSDDEKQAFARHLPPSDYQFVELVQRGQPDWLNLARKRGVRCDALIISGHFDDGSEFYTDRFADREFLTLQELQRTSCSAAGRGLFDQLKEVYLFGCNTLKSEPRHAATGEVLRSLLRAGRTPAQAEQAAALLSARYGQSNRDRLRHVFNNVPVLYGFSSAAPLGRSAGPLLDRYFQSAPAGEVGSGRASASLLKLFAPSSMISVAGLTEDDAQAGFRRDLCSLADDGPTPARKLGFVHALLQRDVTEARMMLDHLEHHVASISPAERLLPDVATVLAAMATDNSTRDRFMALARDADSAAVQARMMGLARSLGWLSPAGEQAEFVQMLASRMAQGRLGRHEVALVCEAPQRPDAALAQQLLASGTVDPVSVAHAAVLACLGNADAHARSVRALTSLRDEDAAIAQTYLRHRQLAGVDEQRAMAAGISRMSAGPGQVRALEALGRQRLDDPQSLHTLADLFAQTRSLATQRAIAGVLIRADTPLPARAELARSLRQHRLKSPDGSDVIDMLIRTLVSAQG